jgi:hypothetical protein
VEQEPLHHVVLKNESVVVIHLILRAAQRTLYPTHAHDRVAVHLSAMTLAGGSYTHRVHNVGSEAFEVLDVELLERPHSLAGSGRRGGSGKSERACLQLGARARRHVASAHAFATLSPRCRDGMPADDDGPRRTIVYPRDEAGGLSMGGQQSDLQLGQRREFRSANAGD